jgi:biopolymer transport protein ExbB
MARVFMFLPLSNGNQCCIKIDVMGQIRENIKNGRIDNAKKCAHSKSPVARLIEKGISRIGKPLEDINTAIENAGKWKFINLKRM